MTFEWALQRLREGGKVRRKAWFTPWSRLQQYCWAEKKEYGVILNTLLTDKLNGDDLFAEDWEEHLT